MKKFIAFTLVLLLALPAFSAVKVEDLVAKIRATQDKIQDMEADVATKMTSTMKDSKPVVQRAHLWVKGKGMAKMEMTYPQKQTTITDGTRMAVINPETGQKYVQDLKGQEKMAPGVGEGSPIDQTKVFDYFDLKVEEKKGFFGGVKEYIITGTPKEPNKFLGKMVFFIDGKDYIPQKIEIYNPKGTRISTTTLQYKQVSGVFAPEKNVSVVSLPGGEMKVEMEFMDIKVNKGIPDSVFNID